MTSYNARYKNTTPVVQPPHYAQDHQQQQYQLQQQQQQQQQAYYYQQQAVPAPAYSSTYAVPPPPAPCCPSYPPLPQQGQVFGGSTSSFPAAFLGPTPPSSCCAQSHTSDENGATINSASVAAIAQDDEDNDDGQDSVNSFGNATQQSTASSNHNDPNFVSVYPSCEAILPRENKPAHGHVPWVCYFCGQHTFGGRCRCGKSREAAALRVFVGQLCREGAGPMVLKMIETLCAGQLSAPVLYVEEHTSGRTQRGKGVCWVNVHTPADIEVIVRCLNKRSFVAISEATGEVGFRVFPSTTSTEEIAELQAAELATLTNEARGLVHHSLVTAEMPLSLKAAINYVKEADAVRARVVQQQQQQNAAPAYQQHYPSAPAAAVAPVVVTETPVKQQRQQPVSNNSTPTPSNTSGRRYRWNPYVKAGSPRVILAQ